MDRIQIFAAAVDVWNPLTGLPRVIQIQHRGDRIHAQSVDVIFVEPEKRVCDQEITDFVATEIKNERPPILMLALARVHVLVKIGPVEFRQRVRIFRKMRRHPIHDHCDSGLVTFVDEMAELVRISVATRRREIIRDLIAPRTFKGMFRYRQQLDMRVTHLEHVRNQRLDQFEIT